MSLLIAGSAARGAEPPDVRKETGPKEAVLQNSTLLLRFRTDERGLRLTSLGNLLTRREYLHPVYTPAEAEGLPPPSLWEARAPGVAPPVEKIPDGHGSADASAIGNPFYLVRQGLEKTEVFHAAADFDVVSSRATPRSFEAKLRGRGILVEADFKVTLAPDRSFWSLSLRNLSNEPLFATLGFPAFARLFVDGPRRDRVTVPWGSGATLQDLATLRWSAEYGAGLSAPMALWHGASEGLYLVDNNRSDTLQIPHEAVRRSLAVGPVEALGKEYGPSLALEHSIRLDKGAEIALGPVVLGTYRGAPMLGAAYLAQIRSHMIPMARPVPWIAKEPMVAHHTGALPAFTDGPFKRGWKVALLSGFSDPALGNYASIPETLGGSVGLRKAAAALHEAGGRVLFVLDGSRISKDSTLGKADGESWAVRGFNGRPVEEGNLWVLCPANAAWRASLGNVASRLLRVFGADGIAITGLAGASNYPCYSRNHGHSSSHAWVWGTRQVFSDLRRRLDKDVPGKALVGIGALDLAREFADALVADTHTRTGYRFELPLLRAVYPNIRTYESAFSPEELLSDRLRAWNVACGLPLYAPSAAAATDGPLAPRRLYEEYPIVFDARYFGGPILTPSRNIVTQAVVGSEYVLMAGNLGEENFTGPIRLPFRAAALENKLTGQKIEPDAAGLYTVSLLAQQNTYWRIIPNEGASRQ
ncbi:MAG: hypothetical protein KY468_05285 [Armatimonadetes bacterium]|nr:hypothetical protein [Armatimonadota bacterium]